VRAAAGGRDRARAPGARPDHRRRDVSRMPASSMANAGRRAIAFPRLSPATPGVARPQPSPITRETVVPRTPSRRPAPRRRLAELMPRRLGDGLTFLLELLVAVPSVVYGLMGVFVLVPLMRSIGAPVERLLGGIPLFSGPVYGIGLLTAGVLLAVMIVPYIIAVGRE